MLASQFATTAEVAYQIMPEASQFIKPIYLQLSDNDVSVISRTAAMFCSRKVF